MHERLNEEIQRENMKGKSHTKDRKIRKKWRDVSNKYNVRWKRKGMIEGTSEK